MPKSKRKSRYKPKFKRGQHVMYEGKEYMVAYPDQRHCATIRLSTRFRPYARPYKIANIHDVKKNRNDQRKMLKAGDFVLFDFNSSPEVLSVIIDRVGDDIQIQPIHVRHIFQLSVFSNRIGLVDFIPTIGTPEQRLPILYNPLLQSRARTIDTNRHCKVVDYEIEADRYLVYFLNGDVDWVKKESLDIVIQDEDSYDCEWIQVGELNFTYNDLETIIGCSYPEELIKLGEVDMESIKRDLWYKTYQSGENHFATKYSTAIDVLTLLMWLEHYPTYWKRQTEMTYSHDDFVKEVDNKLIESLLHEEKIDVELLAKIEKRKLYNMYIRRRAAQIENALRGKPMFKTNFYYYDDAFKVQVMQPSNAIQRSNEFGKLFIYNYIAKILWFFSNKPSAPTWAESQNMINNYKLGTRVTRRVKMKLPLKPFQEKVLYEMKRRESQADDTPLSLITKDGIKFNVLSGYDYTFAFRGGILSLGTGMGKTICTLALIAMTVETISPTLIVVPLTIIDQWISELKKFTHLTYAEIHGRKNNTTEALKKDVVFTTYGTLMARRSKSDFFCNGFHRVVFDESHQLKTHTSSKVQACYDVNCIYRWCLTATPLRKGTVMNLQTQLKMLCLRPFNFNVNYLKSVMEVEDPRSKWIIHQLSKIIIKPKLEDYVHIPNHIEKNISVDHPSIYLYNFMYYKIQEDIKEMYEEGNVYRAYQRIKSLMNQLSICATDPSLVPVHAWGILLHTDEFLQTNVESLTNELKDSSFEKQVKETIQNLQDTSCCLCLENITRPTITNCLHIFCHDCIKRSLEFNSKCPMCRGDLNESRFKEIKEEDEETKEEDGWIYTKDVYGRKIKIIKDIYNAYQKIGPNLKLTKLKEIITKRKKIVVYSQYNNVLEAFSKQIDSCIITGKSSRSQRKKNIEEFKKGKSKVFFLSTKVADVGINLTEGDTLVFLEPGLENEVKEQAIGRLKRIGQENTIHIYNLFSKNTIEERIEKYSKQYNEYLMNLLASNGSRSYKSKKKKQFLIRHLLSLLEIH